MWLILTHKKAKQGNIQFIRDILYEITNDPKLRVEKNYKLEKFSTLAQDNAYIYYIIIHLVYVREWSSSSWLCMFFNYNSCEAI